MYKDAIETAAESDSVEISESLLKFFVEVADKECFCATLYTCYSRVRADVVMELAWRNGLMDFAMPYLVQYVRDLTEKVLFYL
jgi:clathrin heavy chain